MFVCIVATFLPCIFLVLLLIHQSGALAILSFLWSISDDSGASLPRLLFLPLCLLTVRGAAGKVKHLTEMLLFLPLSRP